MSDISKIVAAAVQAPKSQFEKRMRALKERGMSVESIKSVVERASTTLQEGHRSFVIYGDPQSGKTEMMISLNAKLLDMEYTIIVNLVNDSRDMLAQNLNRFTSAGLNPAPKTHMDIEKITFGRSYVFLSTKNAKNLQRLNDLLGKVTGRDIVVIDDEADHATPNAKINSDERSKINDLIRTLLGYNNTSGTKGAYIGVTATPARLDLNATFENESEQWIYFEPHSKYVGQDFFFPQSVGGKVEVSYRLHLFPHDTGDDRRELREAILCFLCTVAEINTKGNASERNFSMLIHTSGNNIEQAEDEKILTNLLSKLSNPQSAQGVRLFERIYDIARSRGMSEDKAEKVIEYVVPNITRDKVGLINSRTRAEDRAGILKPSTPFTFAIGGNIVSRGLTFENLLSMYFTRTVKGNFQQDTYIQRARMFGTRDESLLPYFELWIPGALFQSWHKCFSYHKMSVEAIKDGRGAPVWISGNRVVPTGSGINRAAVNMQGGEMSFGLFSYNEEYDQIMEDGNRSPLLAIDKLHGELGDEHFPNHIYIYIKSRINAGESVFFHSHSEIGKRRTVTYSIDEINNIRRVKGFFGATQMGNRNEIHHLRIFVNPKGKARLFYKIRSESVKFISRAR